MSFQKIFILWFEENLCLSSMKFKKRFLKNRI